MSKLPLRIAFLWHNHQPFYKKDGEFILPWTRLHGVKDYYDLPLLLNEFPKIKETYNIVPSLFSQILSYIKGDNFDTVQKLTRIPANKLTDEDKNQILKQFFLCNENNLIRPYPRFSELLDKSRLSNPAINFTTQDWLDLQVWYNLAWLGEFSKNDPFAKRLFFKGRDFNEKEKNLLLQLHIEILSKIKPLYDSLKELGQINISTTPFYHPILPLLCDSEVAKESNPLNPSTDPIFKHPEDAENQIKLAINFYEEHFNEKPVGFWPSEGSISNEVLDIFIKEKILWVATDESVLFASEAPKTYLEKYFPRKYQGKEGDITIFFRDHVLSDKIGFVYSNWNPHDAARDFVNSLLAIKSAIENNFGEDGLKNAIVPIILDGENCWEYYPKNGLDFQRAVYSLLSNTQEIETCFFTDAAQDRTNDFLPPLNSIRAGSWIDANFNIWIGHNDDIEAWNMLAKARNLFEEKKSQIKSDIADKVYDELLIAEGSDWFWWYGPEHKAENKPDFDVLFRWHIKNIYELLNENPPDEVYQPIPRTGKSNAILPKARIYPEIDGIEKTNLAWKDAGYLMFTPNFSTMHQSGTSLTKIFFGNNEDYLYFKIEDFWKLIKNKIIMLIISNGNISIQLDSSGITIKPANDINLEGYSFSISQDAKVKVPLKDYSNDQIINIKFELIDLLSSKIINQSIDYELL